MIGRYVAWPADRRQLLHHEVGRPEVFVGAVQPAHHRNGDRAVLQPVHHKHLPAQVVIREDVDLWWTAKDQPPQGLWLARGIVGLEFKQKGLGREAAFCAAPVDDSRRLRARNALTEDRLE